MGFLGNPALIFAKSDVQQTAIYDFLSTDVIDGNQATWKNKLVSATPSKNIIYNSSGLIPSEGSFSGTISQHFANGPNYTSSAAKVTVLNTVGGETSGSFYKPYNSRSLPVGSYTFKFKYKTATAGVTMTLRYGVTSTTVTTNFTATDSWQTLSVNFTVASTATGNYFIIGSQIGTGSQSFLIDEIQLYNQADTIPAYTDDGNDGHISKQFGARFPITKNGNYVTNTPLALHSPDFPNAKTWSEMTMLFAVQISSDTTQILFSSIADSFYGTTATQVTLSLTNGEPVFTQATVNRTGKLNDQGFVIIGMSFNSTVSASYINEVNVLAASSGVGAGIAAQIFSLCARLPTTSPLLGDLALLTIWDKKLNASDWYNAVATARQRLLSIGATPAVRDWYIAEGDSITASFSAPQGESFAYQMATTSFTGGKYIGHVNLGTGGHDLATMEGDITTLLTRIQEAKRGGGKAIVSLLVGRNDNGTLTSTAACDAYWVRLKTFYTNVRNAGGLMIACTILPSGTAATNGGPSGSFETARLYLNGLIRAGTSFYDGLADFGNSSISIMGDVATCENPTYYAADGVHPYPAGHTLLKGIIQPVIQSLL